MGVRQQFHLVKMYKRGISDKFVDMTSRHAICVTILLKYHFFLHESYVQQYSYFQDVHSSLSQVNQVVEFFYHLHHNLFFHLGKKDVVVDGDMEKPKNFIE